MVRWWRLALLVLAGVVAAAAGTVLAVAVNVATGGTARWFPAAGRHPVVWTAGATAAVAGASLLVWATQRWYERGLAVLVPAVQRPEPWVVDRPGEVDQIVAALRRHRGATVGITTAVQGAGGFGKTTVAKMVRADRRVLRRFGRRVYWVTLGRDAGMQALVGLVNGLIAQVEPGRAVTFTDARQAGEHLAAVLAAGPRRLVVLDDVWSQEQLAVFPVAGRSARLVTTRMPSLAAGASVPVKVDQMSETQAQALLSAELPPLRAAAVRGLLEETGRWPLLVRLVNKILADQARLQPDLTKAAEDLLGRLRRDGALQVDQLTGAAAQQLDISDPDQRQKAIRATIQASTSLLSAAEHDRLTELAVFAEDETVPVTLLAALWQATSGLDQVATRALCARLADLALMTLTPGGDGGAVTMHDVIRDFLREQLGTTRLAHLHQVLLETAAASLQSAPAAAPGRGTVTAWWELPEQSRYLREHLIEHMLAAGRAGQAEELAADLRWVGARLQQQSGPAAPYADLALIGTPRAERLRRVLGQAAHLLAPTEPTHSLIDILYSRVSHDPGWGTQAQAFTADRKRPALINKWPPPDLPDPVLRRTLTGHTGWVRAVAISPDGAWLASGSGDGSVRVWDPATGQQRAALTGHTESVAAVAISPDGAWLASASDDHTVRVWDPATGQQRAALTHTSYVTAVAISPDGAWLATGSGDDGLVRVWDPATGQQRAALTGHTESVTAVAISPDGAWLASASGDRSVRIWDPATGQQRAALTGHTESVTAVAISPDGAWLASASGDRSVRIWDPATGQQSAALTGHTESVTAVAISPDGAWLASASGDHTVRIWDPATGQQRAALTGHTSYVTALEIAPDGAWLASASGDDHTVRIWDPATGQQRAALTGHTSYVTAVAISPDGAWLASASGDHTVRIWDPATGQLDTALTGHIRQINAVAFAPDGAWLASASDDDVSVRIWDPATGQQRAALTHTGSVTAVAIAPDGAWLASASYDGSVRIWDPATGQQRAALTGHTGWVRAVAIAPDGAWLASASGDHTVRIWDPATGQQRAALTHTGSVTAVAIAPDGAWLASGSDDDGSVRIWDPATGQQRAALTGHTRYVTAVAIAPDGAWLASASYDGSVRIWDPATSQQRAALTGHTESVTAVAIAPDGAWLASASDDDVSVRIWDPATGQQRAALTHTGSVTALAISPGGAWLASASDDGSVRIWDPATGDISALMRVDRPLRDCAWSPSGQSLAAAGEAGLYHFTFKS